MLKIIERISILLLLVGLVVAGMAFMKTRGLKDTEGPAIAMEEDTVKIKVKEKDFEEKILEGITAMDNVDGDVTDSLVIQGLSNFIEKGRRKVTIVAFDNSNNVSKVTREIVYTDYKSPRFSLEEPLRYATNSSYSLDSAFEVKDMIDGDLTKQVTVTVLDDFTTADAGDYTIEYAVTNTAGDEVLLPVTVTYYNPQDDNACPKAILSDYLIYMKKGTSYDPEQYLEGMIYNNKKYDREALEGLAWNDPFKYRIDSVEVDQSKLNTNKAGVYEVEYSITNEENYTATVRQIVIVE